MAEETEDTNTEGTVEETTEGQEGQENQTIQADTQQIEEFNLEKDPRWEKEWKKDVNNLYKAVKGYDKAFTPAQQLIKKYGYKDFAELDPVLNEYKTFKDPQNPSNVIVSKLDEWAKNPEMYKKIAEAFQNWEKDSMASKASEMLGTPLNGQLTPQMIELMNKVNDLEGFKNQIVQKEESSKALQSFEETLSGLKEITTQYGVKDYDELNFLKEFKASGLPIQKIEGYFLKNYLPKIVESAKTNTQKAVVNNFVKNKSSGGLTGSKQGKVVTKEPTLQEELAPIIKRLVNKE